MTGPRVQFEPSEYVSTLVREYYEERRAAGDFKHFSASQGDGYRTLDHADLQAIASIAEGWAKKVEEQWTQRVGQFLSALDDLAGQAQDEIETSTPEDAISWAKAQFEEIFKVTA